jgi:hypothetical protein
MTVQSAHCHPPLDTLWHINLEVEHPLCSSDQTPPDYHIFGPFKDALIQHFTSDKEKEEAVPALFVSQPKTYFLRA